MIEIVRAAPHTVVQDLGFPSGVAFGLPPGGAMDPYRLRLANLAVGNPASDAGLEWALGPLALRFGDTRWVSGFGQTELRLNGNRIGNSAQVHVPAGGVIEMVPGQRPLFSYFAIEGGLAVPSVLGSRATYLPGGFGGFEGRRLKPGDRLPLGPAKNAIRGLANRPEILAPLEQPVEIVARVTRGPQWDRFDTAAQEVLLAASWTVDRASDRMGYRLTGPPIAPRETATLPSEAACPGAIQVPDNGQPIVIMPDGPTVGGYPKIAVVVRSDLALVAQSPPGSVVRFRLVELEEARAVIQSVEAELRALEASLA